MIDATSGGVVSDGPAGTTKLMIEIDTGGKGKQSDHDAHDQVVRGASAVRLEGKRVFAGSKHRFDPLADG
jgi:hypothetical protein